jgi:hypothetical protein
VDFEEYEEADGGDDDEDVDVGDVERDRFAFDNVPSSMMLPKEMMDTGAEKTKTKKGGAEKNPPAAAVARTAKAGTTNAQAPAAKAGAYPRPFPLHLS